MTTVSSVRRLRFPILLGLTFTLFPAVPIHAQTPPEIGYVYPPGAAAGSAIDVRLGGYNWTPDMQLFVHDPRVKLELTGLPGPVIVPEPPYWMGKKARDSDPPLPREVPAKLTVAPGTPPGLVRWQAANANGATAFGYLLVTSSTDMLEQPFRKRPQVLPTLPASVVGQVLKLEEVDRYSFRAARNGPISLDLWTRRLKTTMSAMLEVRDPAGQLVADGADTTGHDLQLTFNATQGVEYTASLYDADFRGHRSFVYRLIVQDGPRVVAAIPAAGKRGETRPVEFIGYGLATGEAKLESVTRPVTFPADPLISSFDQRVETPFGISLPVTLTVSNLPELAKTAAGPVKLAVPSAMTGALESRYGEDRFAIDGKKGDVWSITCKSMVAGVPLDLAVAVFDPAGKELLRGDDASGSTDAELLFTVPADGSYSISVADTSGISGSRAAVYRLVVEAPAPDFALVVPELLAVPLAAKTALALKVVRLGGHKEPIKVSLTGLPAGVTAPPDLVIPGDKTDLAVELSCAADAAVTAAVISIGGSSTNAGQPAVRQAPTLVAMTMKPRVKLVPEGLDDVRKWPRGATFPAPVLIERLEGYTGEVLLEQTARQQRVRQGITGPDLPVAAGISRVEYPVFLPEWLETTKTSRIILNGVAKVPDPKGNVRHLLNKMELRMGMLPVGAMLKLTHSADELSIPAGQPFEVPISLIRATELTEPATLELRLPEDLNGQLTAEPLTLAKGESSARFRIVPKSGTVLTGEQTLTIRATVQFQGKLPVVAETEVTVDFK